MLIAIAGRAAGQCSLTSTPVAFEPNPPGVSRAGTPYMGGGFSNNLALYRNGVNGAYRIFMEEAWGYSVLDLSHPLNPTALFYHDVRFPLGGPNSVNHGGDGQSNVQTIAVSPDGQRMALSMTGPTSFQTVVGTPDGTGGFALHGDFPVYRANGTLIQHIGNRYIAYDVNGTSATAADITALPTGALVLNNLSGVSETTSWSLGSQATLAGNYILYFGISGLQVIDASNPGPPGNITASYPKTTITSADFGFRTIAAYAAAVDPIDPTKLWVLAELNAQAGENSPSYGLLSLSRTLVKTSAGPIWRIPSLAGEYWPPSPGSSSALLASNGSLFVLMWGQRQIGGPLLRLFSTTTAAWSAVNSSAPPGHLDIPASLYSNFTPGAPMCGFAGAGASLYAYLPTGQSAYVIPMSCVNVNAPAAAIVGPLFVNDVSPIQSCETGTPAECTVFLGDKVTGTLGIVPTPGAQPVTGWNFDFDFHAGVANEDASGTTFPRLRAPDNGVFGNPSAPPTSFTLVGPCDPNVGGANPTSGAGCWSSVKGNAAFAGGTADFTGAEATGSTRQLSIAFEARNQYGSAGAMIASLRWQVPTIRLKAAQILTGTPVDATGSDGHPATAGYSWYFGSNPAAPAGEILAVDPGCAGSTCPHAFPGNGTRNFNVWVKAPYANGYVSPDCPGLPTSCRPTAGQPALKIQVADIQPSFLVNGAAAGPIGVVTSSATIAITNQSNPGGFSPQYFYGLCADAAGASSACNPTTSLSFSGSAGTIPMPQTGGAWFLRIRATYGAGLFVDWLTGSPAGLAFQINVTVVSPLVVGVTANPPAAFTSQAFVFSCNVSGGLLPYTYEWRSPLTFVVGTAPTFQTSSPVAGSVTAWCFVTDAAGTAGSNLATVGVTATPPVVVTVTASANSVQAVASVTFTCNAAGGTGAGFSYRWFGNAVAGTGPTASQTFSAPGNYVATCAAADLGSGAESLNSTTVTVTSPAITASGSATPSWVYPGNAAAFSCAGSGGSAPYTYAWTFTDGGVSSAQNPAHPFGAPGVVSGICTARDVNGVTGSVTIPLTVVPASGSGPTSFLGLSPCRLVDTRNAGPLGGPSIGPTGSPDRVFAVSGSCGIPADARSLVTNVTVTNAGAAGDLALFGGNDAPAGTTSVSFRASVTRANASVIRLATDGSGTIRVRNNSALPLDLIVDVSGYFR